MRAKTFALLAGALVALSATAAQAATWQYNWTFKDQSNAVIGSGTLNMTDNIVVSAMAGTINGQKITFYPNKPKSWPKPPPNGLNIQTSNPLPGTSQIVGVPNTGGANVGYDDIYNFNDGVTYYGGIAVSTGKTATLRVYFITRDAQNHDINTPTDLFSINPNGSYSQVEGSFSVTAVPGS